MKNNLGVLLLHPNRTHWIRQESDDLLIDLSVEMGKNPYEHLNNLIRQQLGLNPRDVIAYPITKYEHGRICLSLGYRQGWDYTVVGFIFVTKDKIRKEYGVKRITKYITSSVESCLISELNTFERWLNSYRGELKLNRREGVYYDY